MISFIIPAHNEEVLLARTLEAIRAAAQAISEPFEMLVVNDASTDGTSAVALTHSARVLTVHHRQISATRNAGAKQARAEMLVFVDADTIVTEAALRAAVRAMRAGAVGGGCAFHFDGRVPPFGRLMQRVIGPAYRFLRLASGCFLFCTRSAFDAVGGFDENLFAAEELVMSRALRRHGRFVVLKEHVVTSGRKLRTYSAREVLGLLARIALTGKRSLRRRNGLEIWYGTRRTDSDSIGASAPVPVRPNRA